MANCCPLNVMCVKCIRRSEIISELIYKFQTGNQPMLRFTNCLPSDYKAIVSWCNSNNETILIVGDLSILYNYHKQLQFNDMISGLIDYNDEMIALSYAKKIYISMSHVDSTSI